MAKSKKIEIFKCEFCNKDYPSKRGLTNHLKKHKIKEIQKKYNKKHGLPVVGDEPNPGRSDGQDNKEDPVNDIEINDDDVDMFLKIVTGGGIKTPEKCAEKDEGVSNGFNEISEHVLNKSTILTENKILTERVVLERVSDGVMGDDVDEKVKCSVSGSVMRDDVENESLTQGIIDTESKKSGALPQNDGALPQVSEEGEGENKEVFSEIRKGFNSSVDFNHLQRDFNDNSPVFNTIQHDFIENFNGVSPVAVGSSRLSQAPFQDNSSVNPARRSPPFIQDESVIVPCSLNEAIED